MTDVALRDYLERMIADSSRVLETRISAVEEKAVAANEWRGAMNDRERQFAREAEVQRRFDGQADRLSNLEKAKANLDGRMAMFTMLPLLVSVAGLIVALTR